MSTRSGSRTTKHHPKDIPKSNQNSKMKRSMEKVKPETEAQMTQSDHKHINGHDTSEVSSHITEPEPSKNTLSLKDINAFTDADLDNLLNTAADVLTKRKNSQMDAAKGEETEGEGGSGRQKTGKNEESLLRKIKLDAHLPKSISESASYFVEKSERGAVRLNPAKVEIIESSRAMESGASQAIAKGLGKGSSKSLLDRIVIAKNGNEVAHELDHDAKTKKKLAVETSGPKWFDMPAPDLTDKLKLELQIIKARNVLDPKHHYKKEDRNAPEFPKYFQMGTIIQGAGEYHKLGRLTRRERREGLVDEVLADTKTKTYVKRKFGEIQEDKQARARRPTSKKRGTARFGSGSKRK